MTARHIPRNLHEVAHALTKIEAFEQSRRERKKVEMRFAQMKRIFRLDRTALTTSLGFTAALQFLFTAHLRAPVL
jgi:hypothetical protein